MAKEGTPEGALPLANPKTTLRCVPWCAAAIAEGWRQVEPSCVSGKVASLTAVGGLPRQLEAFVSTARVFARKCAGCVALLLLEGVPAAAVAVSGMPRLGGPAVRWRLVP